SVRLPTTAAPSSPPERAGTADGRRAVHRPPGPAEGVGPGAGAALPAERPPLLTSAVLGAGHAHRSHPAVVPVRGHAGGARTGVPHRPARRARRRRGGPG